MTEPTPEQANLRDQLNGALEPAYDAHYAGYSDGWRHAAADLSMDDDGISFGIDLLDALMAVIAARDVVRDRQIRADAWDEGFLVGDPWQRRGNPDEAMQHNPYRTTEES